MIKNCLLFALLGLLLYPGYGFLNAFLVFAISVLLLIIFQRKRITRSYYFLIIILALLFITNGLDRNIFNRSGIDAYEKIRRHQFYTRELGSFYRNKLGFYYFDQVKFYINRINTKITGPLVVDKYFSAVHSGIYPIWLLPFVVLGLFIGLSKKIRLVLIYLFWVSLLSIVLVSSVAVLLYLPFINLCLVLGIMKIADKFK